MPSRCPGVGEADDGVVPTRKASVKGGGVSVIMVESRADGQDGETPQEGPGR